MLKFLLYFIYFFEGGIRERNYLILSASKDYFQLKVEANKEYWLL
jgi:hypothetical protein